MMAPASEQQYSLKVVRSGAGGAVIPNPGLIKSNWFSYRASAPDAEAVSMYAQRMRTN